jgi:hypothetical protein
MRNSKWIKRKRARKNELHQDARSYNKCTSMCSVTYTLCAHVSHRFEPKAMRLEPNECSLECSLKSSMLSPRSQPILHSESRLVPNGSSCDRWHSMRVGLNACLRLRTSRVAPSRLHLTQPQVAFVRFVDRGALNGRARRRISHRVRVASSPSPPTSFSKPGYWPDESIPVLHSAHVMPPDHGMPPNWKHGRPYW